MKIIATESNDLSHREVFFNIEIQRLNPHNDNDVKEIEKILSDIIKSYRERYVILTDEGITPNLIRLSNKEISLGVSTEEPSDK